MKKYLLVLSLLFILSLSMVLVGCNKKPTTTKGTNDTSSLTDKPTDKATDAPTDKPTDKPSSDVVKTKLAAPVVTLSEDGLASWEAVENASGYAYSLNGTERATQKTSYQLYDGDTFKVMALGDEENYLDSDYSNEVTYTVTIEEETGIPAPLEGFYMRDPDLIEDYDNNIRYLLYTTNKTKAEDDPVLALRVGTFGEHGWVYDDEVIVLEGETEGWDEFISSGSITKGVFALNGESYNYLIVYAATSSDSNVCNQIGLAVAKEITGPYVKVGTEPVIKFDSEIYGSNMVGCYAPSVINYDKESGIRIFYTYADAYGHFAYFFDADMSDLSNIKGVKAMITNEGNIQGGDAVNMFPNADFLYNPEGQQFLAVKDYSPSPAIKPSFANEFEVLYIDESELYTTDKGAGWNSLFYKDYLDLDLEEGYERCYSVCVRSDLYGHFILDSFELVFTTCQEGNDYLFTQKLVSFIYG